jgi:hypothetical protein
MCLHPLLHLHQTLTDAEEAQQKKLTIKQISKLVSDTEGEHHASGLVRFFAQVARTDYFDPTLVKLLVMCTTGSIYVERVVKPF